MRGGKNNGSVEEVKAVVVDMRFSVGKAVVREGRFFEERARIEGGEGVILNIEIGEIIGRRYIVELN